MVKVSVVVPAYNRAKMLPAAIDGVVAQSLADWEALIVDDASNDATRSVVEAYRDSRIKYLRHESNRGAAAARNTGMQVARGEYIAFLDSDDYWRPDKLALQVERLQSSPPDVGLVYTDVLYEHPDGTTKRYGFGGREPLEGWVFNELINHFVIRTSTVMIRREVMEAVGLFDESIISGQDLLYFASIAHRFQVSAIDDTLSIMRVHDSNLHLDLSKSRYQLEAAYKICDAFGLPPKAMAKTLSRCHLHYGMYLLQTGQAREARPHFATVLRLYPKRAIAAPFFLLSLMSGRPYRVYRALRSRNRKSHRYFSSEPEAAATGTRS